MSGMEKSVSELHMMLKAVEASMKKGACNNPDSSERPREREGQRKEEG